MKRLAFILTLMLLPLLASADAVEIDGIYYNLIGKAGQAEVAKNPNKYSGSVVIPESVVYAGKNYSVTSIKEQAFSQCGSLTSVTIPNSVISIGDNAFLWCSGLTSVHITDIAAWCNINFNDNFSSNPLSSAHHLYLNGEEVKDVVIPNSVTSIGGYAFYECSGLTSVAIPNSVTSIGNGAFSGCSALASLTIGNSVTSIGNYAFSSCSGLTSVTIPNSVISIGACAFSNCTSLTSLAIPNSVTSIGNEAFSGCSGLASLTIGNSVTSIGNGAFSGCSGLASVTIPNSVTTIGMSAFSGCSGLTSVTIPNSVTTIGMSAFSYCSGLTSVIIPNSVTSIDGAFSYCSALTSVTIPNNVTSIDGTFSGCSCLTSVEIPNSVTSIGTRAFSGCRGLTSVAIPNSVTSIGYEAFSGCQGLTSIIIPNSVKSIGTNAFCYCSGLTSVTIPNSATSIESSAFYYCSGLTSVTIPNSVTSIGRDAFHGCSGLTSVNLGSGVNYIGREAFAGCKELNDFYCLAEVLPSIDTDAFKDSYPEYATLHVPANSLNAYKNRVPWSSFGKIVSLDGGGTEPEVKKCATPTISYQFGQLSFNCETEGVTFVSEITDYDIKKSYDAELYLTAAYYISVYATKDGYNNSDVATATLSWMDAELFTDDISGGTATVRAKAVLIQSNGSMLSISGADEGTAISVYDMSGKMVGSATAASENTNISTSLRPGDISLVKIGEKTIKIIIQ